MRVVRATAEHVVLRDADGRARTLDVDTLTADERRLVKLAAERDLALLLSRDRTLGRPFGLAPGPALRLVETTQPGTTAAVRDGLVRTLEALRGDPALAGVLRAGPSLSSALAGLLALLRGPTPNLASATTGAALPAWLIQRLAGALPTAEALLQTLRNAAASPAAPHGVPASAASAPLATPGLRYESALLAALTTARLQAASGAGSTPGTVPAGRQSLIQVLGFDLKALLLAAATLLHAETGRDAAAAGAQTRLGDAIQQAIHTLVRQQLAQLSEALAGATTRSGADATLRETVESSNARGSLPFWWGSAEDPRSSLEQLDWRYRRRTHPNGDERLSIRLAGDWPGLGAFVAQIEAVRSATSGTGPATATVGVPCPPRSAQRVGTTDPTASAAPRTHWRLTMATANADALDRLRALWPTVVERLTAAGFDVAAPRFHHDPALVARLARDCRDPTHPSSASDVDRPNAGGGGLHLRA